MPPSVTKIVGETIPVSGSPAAEVVEVGVGVRVIVGVIPAGIVGVDVVSGRGVGVFVGVRIRVLVGVGLFVEVGARVEVGVFVGACACFLISCLCLTKNTAAGIEARRRRTPRTPRIIFMVFDLPEDEGRSKDVIFSLISSSFISRGGAF